MRLGPVRLPEGGGGGGEEGRDAAAGFVRADGPGGQRGDFAEVVREGRGGRGCGGVLERFPGGTGRGQGYLMGAKGRLLKFQSRDHHSRSPLPRHRRSFLP